MTVFLSRRGIVSATLALAWPGSSARSGTAAALKPATVLYVTLELGNPFYVDLISGLRSALKNHPNWRLEVRAGRTADDASGQLDIMESFLVEAQGGRANALAGLVIDPAQSGPELAGMIARYNASGIPVINTDIPIDRSALARANAHVASFIGSNNYIGGRKAAQAMASRLRDSGEILVLLGAPGSANARNRRNGFVERITQIGKERRMPFRIREWNCNWSASEAAAATDSVIASGTPLAGIFAANDEMALGAAQALGSTNLGVHGRPLIVGYDATPDARKAIADGRMYASISQNPHLMGEEAIQFLARIASKLSVPAEAIIPVSVVSATEPH